MLSSAARRCNNWLGRLHRQNLPGRLLKILAAATFTQLSIEAAARLNVRRERKSRACLGDRLYFESLGTGPPLLLIPGFQGTTRYWEGSVSRLAEAHRVIMIDPLGFGRSPWPDIDYTLDDHLEAIGRTIEPLILGKPVTILAHSFGCVLAAWYAARNPGRVSRMILLGAPVFHDEDDAVDRVSEMSSMAALFALHPILAAESCKITCALRPLVQALSRLVPSRLSPDVMSDSMLHYWKSVNGTLRNVLLGKPIEEAIKDLECDITFIHGSRDQVSSLERVRGLAAASRGHLLTTDDDHQSYLSRSLSLIAEALRRPEPFRS